MSDGTHKPIEQVRPGDFVMAFNPRILQGRGPLAPARVTRTFQNTTRCVINLRGLRMTPGHVCLTDNGAFDTIANILARDATLIHQDATPIRARTGAAIASPEDAIITIRAPHPHTNTPCTIRVRAGIPCQPLGADQFMPLTTWLAEQGPAITPEGRPDDMPIDWPAGCSPWRFARQASWRLTNPDGSHHVPDWVQTALQHADAEHEPQHVANRVITAGIGGGQQAQALKRRIIAPRRSREMA